MELRDYLRILRKRGWIIILTTVLTAAAAWGFSQLQTVEYKSTISVFVRPERIDNGTLLATKQILRGFVRYIDSLNFSQRVINQLGLDMKPDTLQSKVTIASKDEDYIIQIDVQDYDPAQSERVALEWANQFVQWRDQDNLKQRKEEIARCEKIIVDKAKPLLGHGGGFGATGDAVRVPCSVFRDSQSKGSA